MNSSNFDDFDDGDRHLVAFLKQNKPIAPAPATNLEQRIMTEIGRQPIPRTNPQHQRWLKGLILASGAIAAGYLAVGSVNRQFQPTVSEVDRVQIEASLIKSWSASVGDDQISEDSDAISSSYLGLEPNDTSQ